MIHEIEGRCGGWADVSRAGVAEAAGGGAGTVERSAEEGIGTSFAAVLGKLRTAERETDAWLEQALDGKVNNPQEMLRLQAAVHGFQMQVELAAKVVEQVSQAIRTLTRGGQ